MRSTTSSTRLANIVISCSRDGTSSTVRRYGPAMRILVIGGSSFVGRAIVGAALDRGHDVTLFNRGRTDPGAFPQAEPLVGDRNGDLSVLDDRSWDATVDVCAYVPAQVRRLLNGL